MHRRRGAWSFRTALAFGLALVLSVTPAPAKTQTDLEARRHLNQLAEQTGGRSFYVRSPEELGQVYEQIERELRSRYLLVYASSHEGEDFRTVEVKVDRSGAEVQALRGYFP